LRRGPLADNRTVAVIRQRSRSRASGTVTPDARHVLRVEVVGELPVPAVRVRPVLGMRGTGRGGARPPSGDPSSPGEGDRGVRDREVLDMPGGGFEREVGGSSQRKGRW
jgi:hypothetical protein